MTPKVEFDEQPNAMYRERTEQSLFLNRKEHQLKLILIDETQILLLHCCPIFAIPILWSVSILLMIYYGPSLSLRLMQDYLEYRFVMWLFAYFSIFSLTLQSYFLFQ